MSGIQGWKQGKCTDIFNKTCNAGALEHCLSLGILKESRQELWESDKGPRPKKGTRLKGWMQ